MSFAADNKRVVQSLYRQSLRLTKNWVNRRDLWRQKTLEIRDQFEANKALDDREAQLVIANAKSLLRKYLHPDPIIPPQRPGGTKFERNIPPPPLYKNCECLVFIFFC